MCLSSLSGGNVLVGFRDRERETERRNNIEQLPPLLALTGMEPATGVCPDRESSRRPFGLWDRTPTTEPGLSCVLSP